MVNDVINRHTCNNIRERRAKSKEGGAGAASYPSSSLDLQRIQDKASGGELKSVLPTRTASLHLLSGHFGIRDPSCSRFEHKLMLHSCICPFKPQTLIEANLNIFALRRWIGSCLGLTDVISTSQFLNLQHLAILISWCLEEVGIKHN